MAGLVEEFTLNILKILRCEQFENQGAWFLIDYIHFVPHNYHKFTFLMKWDRIFQVD